MSVFALVDCNSFYASCEQAFRPDLWKKPVVVLSNNDGCIIARNREAKSLGIRMGEPLFLREKFFREQQVHIFSANFTLYGSMSSRVMAVLEKSAPATEVYSIDEAFLDLSGVPHLVPYCRELRRKVFREVCIPTSIGLGSTKTLAKLANRVAKAHAGFGGVCDLAHNAELRARIFRQAAVEELWGVGRKHALMLRQHRIRSVADFMACSPSWVEKNMTVVGLRMHQELHGRPCLELETTAPAKQSIMVSRSFGQPLQSLSDIAEALATFTAASARKLREQQLLAGSLRVSLTTNSFRTQDDQYQQSISIRLPQATASTLHLTKYAQFALKKIYREGYRYKKTGVLLLDLSPNTLRQTQIGFDYGKEQKHHVLMETLDGLHDRWGRGVVQLASEGTEQKFQMRKEWKSPDYTTDIQGIIRVGH